MDHYVLRIEESDMEYGLRYYERSLNPDNTRSMAKEPLTFTMCMQYFVFCFIFIVLEIKRDK